MSVDNEILIFLKKQLPQVSNDRLLEVARDIYEQEFGPSLTKPKWTAQLKDIREVAKGLLEENCDARKLMSLLPREALDHVKLHNPKDNATAAEVLFAYADHSAAWHRAVPKTGGKDIGAYQIAQVVLAVFQELEIEANVNTLADGVSPASPFGCIVKHAIDYHGGTFKSGSNWRRAAKSAITESKS